MANPEHVARLKEGAEAWNSWRAKTREKRDLGRIDVSDLDLSEFNLSGLNLDAAKFSRCQFDRTTFKNAKLAYAKFDHCAANAPDFSYAKLSSSHLHLTTFREANFTKATLRRTVLQFTTFERCNFVGAEFGFTALVSSEFRECVGLDAVEHTFPSSIGIDTLFLSGGFSDAFLRGVGVPEEFIQYAASLIGKPIEYYSCFLSYSSNDDEFTRRLYNDLQGKNIRTWFAPEDLKIGDRFRARIDESIRIHDKVVLILSASSVNSDWVETEVESALEREQREKKDVLFPIAIDEEGFGSDQPWAADIRRKRHIGDFRNWKSHDDYTKAFDKLVRDLKKSQPPIVMR